ncbi:unnamed protein product [Euphydryas editha]|uniref:Cuticle protein n=1 Tax=Euphydryas editha TaxID=104508 RepID=A0AAU9TUG0_EUPED|nr:unnamed protein product [Euphydryas editha]
MKSIILLTIIACSYGGKLNKAYLPPEHAQSSSGAELLETPISRPIIVAEAVFHKSNAEPGSVGQHQQTINGYVHIGNHVNSFAHSAPFNIAHSQQSSNGFVEISNQASSFSHGFKAVDHGAQQVEEIDGLEVGSHSSSLAHGSEAIVVDRPERKQAALERNAAILRQDYQNNGHAYAYVYETENGIYGEENGVAEHGVKAEGAYSYTGDDGVQYSITYTADENGFRPQGDHLPTPPPIPEEILKSLEQNARDEAAGIYDDGSYHEEKYGEKAEYIKNDENIENQANSIIVSDDEPATHDGEDEAVVTDALLQPQPAFQRPLLQAFRNPGPEKIAVRIPHVLIGNINKGYLPPVHQALLEDRSSDNGKIVFGAKNHQPSISSKKSYKY